LQNQGKNGGLQSLERGNRGKDPGKKRNIEKKETRMSKGAVQGSREREDGKKKKSRKKRPQRSTKIGGNKVTKKEWVELAVAKKKGKRKKQEKGKGRGTCADEKGDGCGGHCRGQKKTASMERKEEKAQRAWRTKLKT